MASEHGIWVMILQLLNLNPLPIRPEDTRGLGSQFNEGADLALYSPSRSPSLKLDPILGLFKRPTLIWTPMQILVSLEAMLYWLKLHTLLALLMSLLPILPWVLSLNPSSVELSSTPRPPLVSPSSWWFTKLSSLILCCIHFCAPCSFVRMISNLMNVLRV